MAGMQEYLTALRERMKPHYLPPATPGGYDLNHVCEMVKYGPKIKALSLYKTLDLNEFEAAVILHNTDRPDTLKKELRIGEDGWKDRWREFLVRELADSPFGERERGFIVEAILAHSKKDDEERDDLLLTALRIADKVVRFGPLGMMGQPANRGRFQMFYDPNAPFVYGSTEDDKLRAVWNDYFRVLEWIPMLTQRALTEDELWKLVDKEDIQDGIHYVRGVGRMIAKTTGTNNQVEECLKKALGKFYDQFPPMKLAGRGWLDELFS